MRPAEVQLHPTVRSAIIDAARASSPYEMAGAIGGQRFGSRVCVDHFVPLRLTTAGAASFAVDAVAFAAAESLLRQRGAAWLGFVHSHPGGTARPSARDRTELWRDCVQLIVADGDGAMSFGAYWLLSDGECTLPIGMPAAEPVR